MNRPVLYALLLFLVTATGTATVIADTRYVSDVLVITLRTGQGNTFRVLESLPSGTRLEVLEWDDRFARVRTPRGTEGWVHAQYLVEEPVAALLLEQVNDQLARLQEQHQALNERATALRQARTELQQENTRLQQEKREVESRLSRLQEVAARPMELEEENQALQARLITLQRERDDLRNDNDSLRKASARDWFITGAGVLGGGLLLGLILPRLAVRRRRSPFAD